MRAKGRSLALPATLSVAAIVVVVGIASVLGGARSSRSASPPPRTSETTEPQHLRLVDPRVVLTGERQGRFMTTSAVVPMDPDVHHLGAIVMTGPGSVHQCRHADVTPRGCARGVQVPEVWEDTPRVVVPIAVEMESAAGRTDCRREACVVAAFDRDQHLRDLVGLDFGGTRSAPSIRLDPSGRLTEGQDVTVRVAGLAPGTEGVVTYCAAPGPVNPDRCGSPAPEARIVADADGRAVARLRVAPGEAGAAAAPCRRASPCAVTVLGTGATPPLQEVSFAGGSAADLSRGQLVAGLLAAALLAGAALVLIGRTDWSPIGGDPFAGVALVLPSDEEFYATPLE